MAPRATIPALRRNQSRVQHHLSLLSRLEGPLSVNRSRLQQRQIAPCMNVEFGLPAVFGYLDGLAILLQTACRTAAGQLGAHCTECRAMREWQLR